MARDGELHREQVAMKALLHEILFRLGAMLALLIPLRNDSGLFFFFPCYHVGGAERVHADILRLHGDKMPWIVITNRSETSALKEEFSACGRLLDLSWPAGRRGFETILTGYLAACINRCASPVVFGSNSSFYYLLLPRLHQRARCVDLIHAFGCGTETVSLPYVERLDRRVVINEKSRIDLVELYRQHGVRAELAERIDLVENKVDVPDNLVRAPRGERLRVLYVGRGTSEKRAHLVGRVARACVRMGVPAEFTLIGDLADAYPAGADREGLRFIGELHDPAEIKAHYRQNDLLILPSSREGFPMVIMEAMAHAIVPLATAVGGIPFHLRDGENGCLVEERADEAALVEAFAALIARLHADRALLERLSAAACHYAAARFRGEGFDRYYRALFESARP
ncbi:glycosyltransferase family 4 protein [Geomonas subterranea]|uniref:glycosyltransferase family 4 protein n=1 Tax=Geomonas subterranea TaxID=2847989 RepID=UPI001CD2CAC6|nr:glycosyltransferase family 4 protein [Geomonas fuzhouensis]